MEAQTDRLIVRPFRPDDWRHLLDYLSLPEIYAFEPGEPIDAARARAMAVERSKGRAFWAVELRTNQRMIGHLYFQPVEPAELRTYELGYIFNPAYQRQGYATEATRALIDHAFAEMGVHRVVASCNPANVASWRVLEKIGFVREGHLRQNIFFRCDTDGRPIWQDTFEYARLSDLDAPEARQPAETATSRRSKRRSPMTHPARYQVRVRLEGELSPAWTGMFADLAVTTEPDGTTLVRGELADQAAVHGLLAAIRDLGLSMISVETVAIPRRSSR
jgi:ribosomal-protein-alanine N-acetyltransferase